MSQRSILYIPWQYYQEQSQSYVVKGWLDLTIIIHFNSAVSHLCALVQLILSSIEEQSAFCNTIQYLLFKGSNLNTPGG